jgi:hypothetical protein
MQSGIGLEVQARVQLRTPEEAATIRNAEIDAMPLHKRLIERYRFKKLQQLIEANTDKDESI